MSSGCFSQHCLQSEFYEQLEHRQPIKIHLDHQGVTGTTYLMLIQTYY